MTHPTHRAIDEDLVAALNGAELVVRHPGDAESLIRRARLHGVELLLLRRSASVDATVARELRRTALAFAAWELQHRKLLESALRALHEAGVPTLLIKGAALAGFLYDDPALRTRADTDILVAPGSENAVTLALRQSGFERVPGVPSHQATFVIVGDQGTPHSLDVHWRINNSELLAGTFDFDELAARSMPLPGIEAEARGPSVVDSLLIACMHRATHRHYAYRVDGQDHHDPDRLIWLYDIHLLASRMSSAEWDQLQKLAAAKGLRGVLAEGLTRTAERFGTVLPERAAHLLASAARREAPSRYLASSHWVRTWMDLGAMRGWSARFRWLRDVCLPPADYVRAKYPGSAARGLASLYVRRALEGAWKRVRPARTADRLPGGGRDVA